jgi:hypothetical protein
MSATGDNAAQIAMAMIGKRLHEIFDGLIDLSNVPAKNESAVEQNFLTRAFGALYLIDKANLDPATAASCVCDDGADDGVDSVHVDPANHRIYFGQSKWKSNTNSGIGLAEVTRFRDGIKAALEGNWNDNNKALHRFKDEIDLALRDIEIEVVAYFAHTSTEPIAENIQIKINEFITEQNKYNPDFIRFVEFRLPEATRAARFAARSATIDAQLMLSNWGKIHTPYEAVFGHIAAADLTALFEQNGNQLFTENLRYGIEKSEVNEGIIDTAKNNPENFWYYNNGITAVCDSVTKLAIGGNDTGSGIFDTKKLSIINGAQTVTSLSKAKASGATLNGVRVHIRVISLKDTPEDFGEKVTSTNNTQNDLSAVDFVAADSNQDRLRREIEKFGKRYVYRRGELSPKSLDEGFDIRLATIALACVYGDLRLAVQAKRYISGLWENAKKEPYTLIFNPATTGEYVIQCVEVMKWVDAILEGEIANKEKKEKLILVHGNRFILFCVFRWLKKANRTPKNDQDLADFILKLIDFVTDHIVTWYPEAYPGNFFKNQERQAELIAVIGKQDLC